jgi:hypothetical protein
VNDRSVSAFDGAGKPFKGPSFRAALTILVVCVVAVALVWLMYSAALNTLDGSAPLESNPVVQEP